MNRCVITTYFTLVLVSRVYSANLLNKVTCKNDIRASVQKPLSVKDVCGEKVNVVVANNGGDLSESSRLYIVESTTGSIISYEDLEDIPSANAVNISGGSLELFQNAIIDVTNENISSKSDLCGGKYLIFAIPDEETDSVSQQSFFYFEQCEVPYPDLGWDLSTDNRSYLLLIPGENVKVQGGNLSLQVINRGPNVTPNLTTISVPHVLFTILETDDPVLLKGSELILLNDNMDKMREMQVNENFTVELTNLRVPKMQQCKWGNGLMRAVIDSTLSFEEMGDFSSRKIIDIPIVMNCSDQYKMPVKSSCSVLPDGNGQDVVIEYKPYLPSSFGMKNIFRFSDDGFAKVELLDYYQRIIQHEIVQLQKSRMNKQGVCKSLKTLSLQESDSSSVFEDRLFITLKNKNELDKINVTNEIAKEVHSQYKKEVEVLSMMLEEATKDEKLRNILVKGALIRIKNLQSPKPSQENKRSTNRSGSSRPTEDSLSQNPEDYIYRSIPREQPLRLTRPNSRINRFSARNGRNFRMFRNMDFRSRASRNRGSRNRGSRNRGFRNRGFRNRGRSSEEDSSSESESGSDSNSNESSDEYSFEGNSLESNGSVENTTNININGSIENATNTNINRTLNPAKLSSQIGTLTLNFTSVNGTVIYYNDSNEAISSEMSFESLENQSMGNSRSSEFSNESNGSNESFNRRRGKRNAKAWKGKAKRNKKQHKNKTKNVPDAPELDEDERDNFETAQQRNMDEIQMIEFYESMVEDENTRELLDWYKQFINELKFLKPEDMTFDFMSLELRTKLKELLKIQTKAQYGLYDGWNVALNNDSFQPSSEGPELLSMLSPDQYDSFELNLFYLFDLMPAITPEILSDLVFALITDKDEVIEVIDYIKDELSQDVINHLSEDPDSENLIATVELSIQYLNIVKNSVDQISDMFYKIMNSALINNQTLRGTPGKKPANLDHCYRSALKVTSDTSKTRKTLMNNDIDDNIDQIVNSGPPIPELCNGKGKTQESTVYYEQYNGVVYKGRYNSLFGGWMWTKLALCGCGRSNGGAGGSEDYPNYGMPNFGTPSNPSYDYSGGTGDGIVFPGNSDNGIVFPESIKDYETTRNFDRERKFESMDSFDRKANLKEMRNIDKDVDFNKIEDFDAESSDRTRDFGIRRGL